MGTLVPSRSRLPVSRETLKDFRAAGGEKEAVLDGRTNGVEGETETNRRGTEQRVASQEKKTEDEGEEKEVPHEETPESRNPGTSHDPGGRGCGLQSRPHFPESTDLEGKRKEKNRFKRREEL
ncbi:hypothetical protein NDU88_002602 [Pleurodeles waltl]|uniref:Uncharacterized protein n=1 Tax=Pleurodeles waltl TaxID=8319 RepID=A0AAV7T2W1_PLEWA|nr:hypothetical protein NDU88_002602 [Pleurodeles waltl]